MSANSDQTPGPLPVVRGVGGYLPEKVVTNDELAERVETTDEWIVERTGIRQRHLVAENEMTSDLAIGAAKRALANAKMDANDIDLIVLATSTPDQTFPATATQVQSGLGMRGGAAFDVQAVCAGFVYALSTASAMMAAGHAKRALVIGAETFSRLLDWEDRGTCVLFGDGAGAVVLEMAVEHDSKGRQRGILTSKLHSDGTFRDMLYVDGGVSSTGTIGQLRMRGREVFKHAVVKLASVVVEALDATDLAATDIDWVVPHQANQRIIDATAKKLGAPPEKIISTVAKHANTSAASIPLALSDADANGTFAKGDLLALEAIGGGFAWGSALIRW